MAGNIFGLDLGTYEIKVYDKKRDVVQRAKNVLAVRNKGQIFAAGDDAYEMYGKSPADIQIVFPMKDGVIARFDDMQYMLGSFLEQGKHLSRGAQYVIAVPTDVTEVEKKAFYDLVFHSEARARSVRIVERGLADAVGSGFDVTAEKGLLVVNFGGDTTEVSVLSQGGMVMNRLIKTGGADYDAAIAALVRRNMDFLIGLATAERLRKTFGVFDEGTGRMLRVSGRDLISGVPAHADIPISLVRAAMKELLDECVKAIRSMAERTPPLVRKAIGEKGICLTGGMANMRGLRTYLEESTGLPVRMASEPELCAVNGLRCIISDNDYYRRLTYSMRDKGYRWLR